MRALLIITLLLAQGCVLRPSPPDPGGCVGETPGELCGVMCASLSRLGCEGRQGSPGEDEVFDTEDDVTCPEVCFLAAELDSSILEVVCCSSKAESCDEVDRCTEDEMRR